MKRAPAEKHDDDLLFSHNGRACRVRRVHRHAQLHHASAAFVHKVPANLWQRWLFSLLPQLALGELV
ncbi:MAG TPA: hypothetical protein VFA58_02600 [Chthoniobacterales bacterium]|nr:hypothetical protein [Chthoniobacterales bacterium]